MNKSKSNLFGMDLLVYIYKSLYNTRIKITGSCRVVARYHKFSRMPDWVWLPLVIYCSNITYKNNGSFKWLNDLALIKKNLDFFGIINNMCNHIFTKESI